MKNRVASIYTIIFLSIALLMVYASVRANDGGIGGTGKSVGVIARSGAVTVNGVEFDTSGAKVIVHGKPGKASDLTRGMVVTIEADFSGPGKRAIARVLDYDDTLNGFVERVDRDSRVFYVLGQKVHVDRETAIVGFKSKERPIPTDLEKGVYVEVCGFLDAGGEVRATLVEWYEKPGGYKVKGIVSGYRGGSTFKVGMLTVYFEGKVSGGTLENGRAVRVVSGKEADKGTLKADEVSLIDTSATARPGERFDLEGYVTKKGGPGSGLFEVGGIPVAVDSTTKFRGGTLKEIEINRRIAISGRVSSGKGGKKIAAKSIIFK